MKLDHTSTFGGPPLVPIHSSEKRGLCLKKCSKKHFAIVFFCSRDFIPNEYTLLDYPYCWNISSSIHIYFLKSLYLFSILMTWVLASREPLIDSRGLYAAPRPLKIHAFSICGTMLLAALNSDWKKKYI